MTFVKDDGKGFGGGPANWWTKEWIYEWAAGKSWERSLGLEQRGPSKRDLNIAFTLKASKKKDSGKIWESENLGKWESLRGRKDLYWYSCNDTWWPGWRLRKQKGGKPCGYWKTPWAFADEDKLWAKEGMESRRVYKKSLMMTAPFVFWLIKPIKAFWNPQRSPEDILLNSIIS